jgi:hypothetical protein
MDRKRNDNILNNEKKMLKINLKYKMSWIQRVERMKITYSEISKKFSDRTDKETKEETLELLKVELDQEMSKLRDC